VNSKNKQKNLKTSSGFSSISGLSINTICSQTQTGATVPLKEISRQILQGHLFVF
jgi:hypothetical protein